MMSMALATLVVYTIKEMVMKSSKDAKSFFSDVKMQNQITMTRFIEKTDKLNRSK